MAERWQRVCQRAQGTPLATIRVQPNVRCTRLRAERVEAMAHWKDLTMMPSDPYERITPGMAVLDLAGDRIGSVMAVSGRLPDLGRTGDLDPVGRNQEALRAGMGAAGYVEIDHRGRRLHVPFTAVNEVRDDAVVLTVDREAIDVQGWDLAPTIAP